jgi:hypothetical protein
VFSSLVVQHQAAALILELPTACTANNTTSKAASGSERDDAIISILLVQNIRQVTTFRRRGLSGAQINYLVMKPAVLGGLAGSGIAATGVGGTLGAATVELLPGEKIRRNARAEFTLPRKHSVMPQLAVMAVGSVKLKWLPNDQYEGYQRENADGCCRDEIAERHRRWTFIVE